MELPDFTEDRELNDLRARMGARDLGQFRLSVNPYRFTVAELEALVDTGIELRFFDEVRALEDSTLAYKDRRVLLHARAGVPRPSFHFAHCAEIERMRAAGFPPPHCVSAREDGVFRIHLESPSASGFAFERLLPCEACLEKLGYLGLAPALSAEERARRRAEFMITRFFEKYPRTLAVAPG